MIIVVVCCVLVIGIGGLLYMYWEAHQDIVLEHDIPVPGLQKVFEGYTIYFVSDIHRRTLSEDMLKGIRRPDIVVIGGDLTEDGVPFSRVEHNVQALTQWGVPVLFVWGNHDLYFDRQILLQILMDNEVTLVTNDVYHVIKNGSVLNIVGVNDATNDLDRLDMALDAAQPGVRMLISHNPVIIKRILPYHRIPLVISGHTHGGQIRLFGWGPREKGGIKKKTFGLLVISNGYGTTRYPLRFGAPPDTLVLHLRQSD